MATVSINSLPALPKSKLSLVGETRDMSDKRFETKPMSFAKDAIKRFFKKPLYAVSAGVLIFLILIAYITPLFFDYGVYDHFSIGGRTYQYARPKGLFADGTYVTSIKDKNYMKYLAIGMAAEDIYGTGRKADGSKITFADGLTSNYSAVVADYGSYETTSTDDTMRSVRLDSYNEGGFVSMTVSKAILDKYKALQEETGVQFLYPIIYNPYYDVLLPSHPDYVNKQAQERDPNVWYQTDTKGNAIYTDIGKTTLKDNYLHEDAGTHNIKNDNGTGAVLFERKLTGDNYEIRVLVSAYYLASTGNEPGYLLGTDDGGRDVFLRTAVGMRTSFTVAFTVFVICFVIGVLVGSLMGFYGGKFDLFMKAFLEILGGISWTLILLIVREKFINTGKVSGVVGFILSYIATGWIGFAGMFRMQFYRFKGQEYVTAAKTLGSSDLRLMFKHIFPNTIGWAITACAFSIPMTMMSESTMSYLKVMPNYGGNAISLGEIINTGLGVVMNKPFVVWPAIIAIGLMILCFNFVSNGMRDAINPILRGA